MFEDFRRRMDFKGNSRYERAFKQKQRSFNEWFKNTLTRQKIAVDGVDYYAVVQDQNQANNKGLSDDKYLIVENDTPTHVGSIIGWRDKNWIVFSNEEKTIETHKQHHIKQTNHVIKWMNEDGTVSNNGSGYSAYVQNNTLYTLGVSMSGAQAWIVNAKMVMYLPYSEEAKKMKIGQRVFIGENVYEVMMKDFVSRKGLIHFLLEENFYNPNVDDLENGIADKWKDSDKEGTSSNEENNADNNVETATYTMSIGGGNTLKIGKTATYQVSFTDDGGTPVSHKVTEWTLVDVDKVATIQDQTDTNISIRVDSNFSYVGKQFTVVAKSDDGVTASKTVNVISPY